MTHPAPERPRTFADVASVEHCAALVADWPLMPPDVTRLVASLLDTDGEAVTPAQTG